MEFRKLRLTGFKSFVEPTEMDILPGLTGIVGPNGCGKSNLLEALRWVMGATSAKALRAGGMEDVIFSGSGTRDSGGRPARSWAEVTLTLGNDDRTAPPQFNDTPVLEVTRRIAKRASGAGSTYRINGKEVRARDLQLLFADAATGANSPALVRQGQVSDLINAKPENRRKFLEDAAGVAGLYTRRHEAELRLKAAEQNLERLEDVSGELESQRRQLERQAAKAKKYRALTDELKKTEALLAYVAWSESSHAAEQSEATLKTAISTLEQTASAAASAQSTREAAQAKVDPLREKEVEAAAALSRLEAEQRAHEKEMTRAEQEIRRLRNEIDRLEKELAREQDLGTEAGAALQALDEEDARLITAGDGEQARLDDAEREVATAEAAMEEAERDADTRQREAAEARATESAARTAAANAARALEDARRDVARALSELETFGATAPDTEALHQLEEDRARHEAALGTAEAALADIEQRRAGAEIAVAAAEGPRDETRATVNALQAEVDTLTRILAATEPEGRSLIEGVTVEPGFEQALAAALEGGVDASDDAEAARHWSARGTHIVPHAGAPKDAVPLSEKATGTGALSRRLALTGIVDAADGDRLAKTLLPGQRLVSVEGDLWRWDGFVSRASAKSAAALRLEQKRDLAAKEAALAAAFRQRDEAERALGEAKSTERTLTEDRKAQETARDTARRAMADIDRTLSARRAEQERRAAKGEALIQRKTDADERAERAEAVHAEAQAAVTGLPDLSHLDQAAQAARGKREQTRAVVGRARGRRADLRRERDARTSRRAQIATERSNWQRRLGTAGERLQTLTDDLTSAREALLTAEDQPARLAETAAQLSTAVDAAESRRRVAADALEEVQTALVECERAVRQTDEAASQAREEKARAEAQREAALDRLRAAEAQVRQIHQGDPRALLKIAEASQEDGLPREDDLTPKRDRLVRDREALGGVNLLADQELEDINQRLGGIGTEKADCESAIAKLRGAIATLNKDGRERLLTAFDTVNRHFKDLFGELFGGGQAELKLVDSDDPLEAGLEIFASPPGKKLAQMSLMSGGEQALTATALIFAVFRSNPAPVCVLDEVDAPLDDANTDRLCNMVTKIARETGTRFIAITHHPLTMSRMDRLFGVTMVERGVSRLVSVDLAEAEKLAA